MYQEQQAHCLIVRVPGIAVNSGTFCWIVGQAAMSWGVEEVKLNKSTAEMTPVGLIRKTSFCGSPAYPRRTHVPWGANKGKQTVPFEPGQ